MSLARNIAVLVRNIFELVRANSNIIMSDLRRVLRYEIPGLLAIINIFLILISFINGIASLYIINRIHILSIGSIAVALPLGWVIFQVYTWREEPEINTDGFNLVKNHWNEIHKSDERDDAFYLALIDYVLLKDTSSCKRLDDILRGYWDHYHARRTLLYGCIFSLIITIFFILYIHFYLSYLFCLASYKSNISNSCDNIGYHLYHSSERVKTNTQSGKSARIFFHI